MPGLMPARFFAAFDHEQSRRAFRVTGEEREWDEAAVWDGAGA